MLTVAIERPSEWDVCEVHCFADTHLGDPLLDEKLLAERIKRCEETENCIVLLNGDLCNNATTSSVSDTYGEKLSPMQALKKAVEIFGKLAEQGKIAILTDGNHERRTYRSDGIDMSAIIAQQLGVPYSPGAAIVFLRFGADATRGYHGRKMLYTVMLTHGAGGGKEIGGKAAALYNLSRIADCDVYIRAHTHEPISFKRNYFRTSASNNSVQEVERLFVNVGSFLTYGGYGEVGEFVPSSRSSPVIYLDGHRKHAYTAEAF